jgi:hypothetical protein
MGNGIADPRREKNLTYQNISYLTKINLRRRRAVARAGRELKDHNWNSEQEKTKQKLNIHLKKIPF